MGRAGASTRTAGCMAYERSRSRAAELLGRRTVVAKPARLRAWGRHLAGGACQRPRGGSAYGWLHGVRTSSQSGGLAKAAVEDGALSTPNTADLRPGAPREVRRTVVATARPSASVGQTPCGRSVPAASGRGSARLVPWRTNVLPVGAVRALGGAPEGRDQRVGPGPKRERQRS